MTQTPPLSNSGVRQMPSTNEIRQAVWSVQYNTQFRRKADAESVLTARIREAVLPIQLDAALEILIGSYDDHDLARRSSAFVKIGAAGLFRLESLVRFFGNEERAQRTRALIVTLADAVGIKKIEEALSQKPSNVASYVDKQLLATINSTPGTCVPIDATCVACIDGRTWETTVAASARVPRPIAELAEVLDPRNWNRCGTTFKDIAIVQWNTSTSKWERPNPPILLPGKGQSWSTSRPGPHTPERGLFEHVQIGQSASGQFIAEFQNVLNIDFVVSLTGASADKIEVTYSLNTPLEGMVFGQPIGGGLINDEGYARAIRDATSPMTWSRVEMQKTVQFVDLTPAGGTYDFGELLNYMAPGMLCLWLEEPSQISPCCQLTP